jgi:iron(III) transport system permease protein
MVSATYRAMNPALEEAAAIHGLGFLRRLRRITLPLTFPGILAAGIYIVSIGIGAFDIPRVMGMTNRVFTASTFLYDKVIPQSGPSRFDLAGAFGVLMMGLALVLLWWYFRTLRQSHRYAVVTGKAYQPRLIQLGRWQTLAWGFLGGYFLLSQVLPSFILVWNSLIPYLQPISLSLVSEMSLDNFGKVPWSLMLRGIRHSLILAVSVPTLTIAVALAFSWIVVRSRSRFRFFFDTFAFLPHTVPHILLATSAAYVVLFLLPGWMPLYGEIWLLIAVYVLIYISFATRMLNSAMLQIHQELDEAAMVSGISLLQTIRKILIPLVKPTLLSAWLWIALLTYRELTIASILAPTVNNITVSRAILAIWEIQGFSVASAAVTIMMLVMLPLIFVYWFFARRALAVQM